MAELARALARAGAVVLDPDVRVFRMGGGWPIYDDDVVCVVAAGRHLAAEQGRGSTVTLIGWGDGVLVATAVTLGWTTLSAGTTGCSWPVPIEGPDRLVGVSGHYGWPAGSPDPVDDGTIAGSVVHRHSCPQRGNTATPAGGWCSPTSRMRRSSSCCRRRQTSPRRRLRPLRERDVDVDAYGCGDASHEELIHPLGVLGAAALGTLQRVGLRINRDPCQCSSPLRERRPGDGAASGVRGLPRADETVAGRLHLDPLCRSRTWSTAQAPPSR